MTTSTANVVTINDQDFVQAKFNIMKGKEISEKISFSSFRVGDYFVEATFDREYMSEMDHSPSHITMTVIPLLTQRVCYGWLCHHFDLPYAPDGDEKVKMWPTWLEFKYPNLISSEKSLNYKVKITSFKQIQEKQYLSRIQSTVNNELEINAKALVILV